MLATNVLVKVELTNIVGQSDGVYALMWFSLTCWMLLADLLRGVFVIIE